MFRPFLVLTVGVVLTACQPSAATTAPATTGTASGSAPGSAAGHVAASEKEFSITLGSATVTAGPTAFDVKNDGAIAHEFVVAKTDLAPDKLPQASGEVDEGGITSLGEVEDVAPGTTKSFTADLTAGHYVVFCNIPGHYAAGMHAELVVR
jgi:uncharacterized cupredoxin-like copper-binding protein